MNTALDEEMSADPSVFLMGEEVPPVPVLVYFLCSILASFGLIIVVSAVGR